MSEKKETPPVAEGVPALKPDNVHDLYPDRMEYDTELLNSFLSMVFHVERPDEEIILTQASPKAPRGYGKTPAQTERVLTRTQTCMPCYFGTSSLVMTDGNLRNKRTAFKRYYTVVLDDIGTKIPWDKLPKDLDPTFKIETSPGNFQLGFVLDTPLDNYDEASILCHYVKQSGLTDKGGIMPCKKVRLPLGVNGKKGPNKNFPVKLHDMDGPYWSPEALLKAMGMDIDWVNVIKNGIPKREQTRAYGASAWSPIPLHHFNGEGIYDPVMEWLEEQQMVTEEINEDGWATIICPWHHDHSGDPTAGYSPVGHGLYADSRNFHCFHDHCADKDTLTFLQEVGDLGGPRVPARDLFPELAANYVYDMVNDRVFNIRNDTLVGVPTSNFKKTLITTTMLIGGKEVKVNPVDIWLKLPTCVKIMGIHHDPTDPSTIVEDSNYLFANTFTMPHWPFVNQDEEKSAPFKQYLDYLIPADPEREFFIKWLACKAQHRDYRGPAVLMVAPTEGAGRNTLMLMLGKLFGAHNIQDVKLGEFENASFNEYMDKLFVFIDETIAHQDQRHRARFYEHIKSTVDPLAQRVTINHKYGAKIQATSVTSFLFFSNNADAMHVSRGTRRIYTLANTHDPGGPKFFTEVHRWMNTPGWEAHVWAWLLSIDVDKGVMSAKPPMSEAMEEMLEETKSTLDHLIDAALLVQETPIVVQKDVADCISLYFDHKLSKHMNREIVQREVRRAMFSLRRMPGSQIRVNGRIVRVSTRDKALLSDQPKFEGYIEEFKRHLESNRGKALADKINDLLESKGTHI